ncbi:hypothetical protein SLEP1_g28824 [Rubroshorea leprosula]|uniref:Uncharacterized protein n=1 Tax=Rubroshorea leprosula TaxID=152421 RepID=A0AAV5K4K1_9ROSI|nr:hypothetical protein SLEP1_g28824 [Rubroshorea leprosula]
MHHDQWNAFPVVCYSFVVAAACALSLLITSFSLAPLSVIIALWILLYLFKEDCLVLWSHSISDRWVWR